jgi:nickel-type superoxide dismutase maturation protease
VAFPIDALSCRTRTLCRLATASLYRFAVKVFPDFFVRRLLIEGSSMEPTFQAGDRLTALRRWRRVRVGDVVVLRDPRDHQRWIIKRCVAKVGPSIDVRGDNPAASTDSREFGPVRDRDVIYLVLASSR